MCFSQEVGDDTITKYIARVGNKVTTVVLKRLAEMASPQSDRLTGRRERQRQPASWDEKGRKVYSHRG
jgi:hypothetical protein